VVAQVGVDQVQICGVGVDRRIQIGQVDGAERGDLGLQAGVLGFERFDACLRVGGCGDQGVDLGLCFVVCATEQGRERIREVVSMLVSLAGVVKESGQSMIW
jgi:hypothetical protein